MNLLGSEGCTPALDFADILGNANILLANKTLQLVLNTESLFENHPWNVREEFVSFNEPFSRTPRF